MSEHQRIAFRAIDGPVSEGNLEFMRRQSSRAEITPWSFDNEYQFGDFGGNALEMLRRGYDLHLHYANFGIRKLLIRLPHGLPDVKAAKPYLDKDSMQFLPDKQRPGGILSVSPFHEPGDLEDIWDFDDLIDRLVPLRGPLYLAHLVMACDYNHNPEETKEAPVPAGLGKLSDAQLALAELYGLSDSLIGAAAQGCPTPPAQLDPAKLHAEWLHALPLATKDAWLAQWMADPHSSVRSEILVEFRKSQSTPPWPTTLQDRTIAQLEAVAEEIQQVADRKAAEKAASERAKRLADMASDPTKTLRETEKLAAKRSTSSYQQIATLLADLREALAGSKQSGLAEQQARKLKKANPTLGMLTSALRRQGFLKK